MSKTKVIKTEEQFNGDKLAYIIMNVENYRDILRSKSSFFKGDPISLARKYLNKSDDCKTLVVYKQNSFEGRMTSVGAVSFQMISRPIRHTICDKLMVDLDVCNAHPTLLNHMCDENKVHCPHLKEYNLNRDQHIAGDGTPEDRERRKKIYLSLTNGGNEDFRLYANKTPHMYEYKKEMATIREFFAKQNPLMLAQVTKIKKKEKKNFNFEGSLINKLLCKMENDVLMSMWKFFKKNKNVVLCFDGILLPIGLQVDNAKLTACEKFVEKQLKIKIKLKIKPFNEQLTIPPSAEIGCYAEYKFENQHSIKNMSPYSELKLVQLYVDKCPDITQFRFSPTKTGGVYYMYNKHNLLTEYIKPPFQIPDAVVNFLTKYVEDRFDLEKKECFVHEKEKLISLKDGLLGRIGTGRFKNNVLIHIKQYIEDTEITDKIDSNTDLFCFKDQCCDFSTRPPRFRPIERDDYCMTYDNFELPDHDQAIQDDLIKIIQSMFASTDVYKFVMDSLAFACFTNKFDKFTIWSGIGGNGKGVLMSLIESAFGKYFLAPDSKFLTSSIAYGSADMALYRCRGKKIVMSSEPEGQDSKVIKFNIEKIKKLTGGDTQTARTMYQEPIEFKPSFSLFCQCNEKPPLDKVGNDMIRRVLCVCFPNKFCIKKEGETYGEFEKEGDPNLKAKLSEPKYYQQFMRMILTQAMGLVDSDAEIPKEVLDETDDYTSENNVTCDFLEENYDKTEDETDRIECKDSWKLYKDQKDDTIKLGSFKHSMANEGYKVYTYRPTVLGKARKRQVFQKLKLKEAPLPIQVSKKRTFPAWATPKAVNKLDEFAFVPDIEN